MISSRGRKTKQKKDRGETVEQLYHSREDERKFPSGYAGNNKKRKKEKENDVEGDEFIAGKVTLKPWKAETETRRKGRIVKSATYFLATKSPSTGDKKRRRRERVAKE